MLLTGPNIPVLSVHRPRHFRHGESLLERRACGSRACLLAGKTVSNRETNVSSVGANPAAVSSMVITN